MRKVYNSKSKRCSSERGTPPWARRRPATGRRGRESTGWTTQPNHLIAQHKHDFYRTESEHLIGWLDGLPK